MSIEIPPRSSSLVGTRPELLTPDGGRKSRMAFRDSSSIDIDEPVSWNEDEFLISTQSWLSKPPVQERHYDFAMTSPPPSPVPVQPDSYPLSLKAGNGRVAVDLHRNTDFQTYPEEIFCPVASREASVSRIIANLDESTSYGPSKLLLPDTPCISAIRTHLQQSSHLYSQWQVPAPLPSPLSEGLDWRPRPNPPTARPTSLYFTSLRRTLSSRTSKTSPTSQQEWNHTTHDTIHPTSLPQLHNQCPEILPEPNLEPLSAVFPSTSPYLRSALYSHLLAYSFLSTLPHAYSLPHTPPPSPLHLPFFTTTSQSLPNKAADRLGIPVPAVATRRIDVGGNAVIVRHSGTASGAETGMLTERVKAGIAWLIREMSNGESEVMEVDETFLRALAEIVKGCERASFGPTLCT